MTKKREERVPGLYDKWYNNYFGDHVLVKYGRLKRFIKLQLEKEREEMRDEFYSSFQSILDDGWMSTERKIKKVMDDYVFTLKNSKEKNGRN